MPDETPSAPINRELVIKITAANVRRNQVASDQLGTLISTVHQHLAGLGKQLPEAGGERTHAVPIRQSVLRNYVVCSACSLARPHGQTASRDRPWIDR